MLPTESRNQKIQYGCQAAIFNMTSLKINRLLPIYILLLKFGVNIQSQPKVRVRKPKKSNMATRWPYWKWGRWKSIGLCLWPPSICTWNFKLKFQSKLDLCSVNHVVYRQTDGRTRWIQYTPPPTSLGGGIMIICAKYGKNLSRTIDATVWTGQLCHIFFHSQKSQQATYILSSFSFVTNMKRIQTADATERTWQNVKNQCQSHMRIICVTVLDHLVLINILFILHQSNSPSTMASFKIHIQWRFVLYQSDRLHIPILWSFQLPKVKSK